MDEPTKRLIRDLDRFMVRSQGQPPPLEWTESFARIRANVKHLPQYAFCPLFFERMMGLVAGQLRAGKTVSDSMLKTIRAWFNKAKGFRIRQWELYREKQVDLRQLLGASYEQVRDAAFEIFTKLLFDERKRVLVGSLVNEFELTDEQQQWLVAHWSEDRLVLDKMLHYHYPSPILGKWAMGKGLEQGVLLPYLDRLVGQALSNDPDYLLTIRQVKRLMSEVMNLWEHLADLYHNGIKAVVRQPAERKGRATARRWLQAWEGSYEDDPELLDYLEALGKLHPLFPHTAYFFPDLLRQGMPFRLFHQPSFLSHLGVGHFMDYPTRDWVAFELKPFDFTDDSVSGQQPGCSVRNFYQVFPYIDIDTTVAEWHKNARRVRDIAFYKGIHLSCLLQAQKNALYVRYFSRELQEVFFRIIRKESNQEMAGWLRNRLTKEYGKGGS